jgi:hypothetical protein
VLSKAGRGAANLAACGFGATFSAIRGGRKAFHTDGCSFLASFEIDGTEALAEGLLPTGRHPAVVRLSGGVGLPEGWPDGLGVSLRVDAGPDGEFDLLFLSSAHGRIGKRLIVPARRFFDRPYSTIAPFQNGADRVLVGLVPPVVKPKDNPDLSTLRKTWDLDGKVFKVVVAARDGDWREAGRLVIGDAYPEGEALVFDPRATPCGARPVGFLNSLRPWAYPASRMVQAARERDGGPGSGGPA